MKVLGHDLRHIARRHRRGRRRVHAGGRRPARARHRRREHARTTRRCARGCRNALPPAATTLAEVCALDTLIGQAFADAAASRTAPVDAVCSHGQTVYHWVDGGTALGTLQIGQPAWIAERLGVPVVADVRIRDIAAGGQGAPLVSYLDTLLLAGLPGRPAALNLGGIANMTVPAHPAARRLPARSRGTRVRRTRCSTPPCSAPSRTPPDTTSTASSPPADASTPTCWPSCSPSRTTGCRRPRAPGRSCSTTATSIPSSTPGSSRADLVATLTALTARTVADAVRGAAVDTLVVSGGGAANPTLLGMLAAEMPGVRIVPSAELGCTAGREGGDRVRPHRLADAARPARPRCRAPPVRAAPGCWAPSSRAPAHCGSPSPRPRRRRCA